MLTAGCVYAAHECGEKFGVPSQLEVLVVVLTGFDWFRGVGSLLVGLGLVCRQTLVYG